MSLVDAGLDNIDMYVQNLFDDMLNVNQICEHVHVLLMMSANTYMKIIINCDSIEMESLFLLQKLN